MRKYVTLFTLFSAFTVSIFAQGARYESIEG